MGWGPTRYTSHATGVAVNFEYDVWSNDASCLIFQRNKIIRATVQHYSQLKIEVYWTLLYLIIFRF